MIIASKGTVRIKGDAAEVLAEFVTISRAIMDTAEISKDMLKQVVDIADIAMNDADNKTT